MNLLNYTQKLYKKIKFYDRIIKNTNYNKDNPNPFNTKDPVNITIIWVQNDDKKI